MFDQDLEVNLVMLLSQNKVLAQGFLMKCNTINQTTTLEYKKLEGYKLPLRNTYPEFYRENNCTLGPVGNDFTNSIALWFILSLN